MRNDFFKLAPVGCFILTASGEISDVNPAGAAQLGYEPAGLAGRPFSALVEEPDRARLSAYLRHVAAAAEPQRIELRLVRRPGGPFWVRLEARALPAEPGGEAALYLVLADLTAEHATREALAASEERLYRAVLEAPLPVAIFTEDGEIIALSRAWTERTGYTAAELPTLDAWFRCAFGPQEVTAKRRAFGGTLRELFAQPGRRHDGEHEIRTRDGHLRLWDFYSAPLGRLPDGRSSAITMVIDVTERRATEAELVGARDRAEEMARLKSAFLANMSHEIRTPLTGIIGFAAVLAKELPEEQQEFAGLIESSGRRLLDMLNSVLDLAKLEANQVEIHLDRLDLQEECEEVVQLLQPLAREKEIALRFEAGEGAEHAPAYLDRPAVGRILHNLVGNALKFTDHGSVTVRLDADDEYVYLRVSDTGIGIDPMFLPYLFDEFRQESTGVSRTHGGSGLGLAITRRLVELMRGRITVQSEKGAGSTFTLTFARAPEPTAPAEDTPEAEASDPSPAPTGPSRIRLLLVEDQLDTQYLLLELLDELYDVTVAASVAEVLHLAQHTRFDLVLMDIQLGHGPDGIDALHRLRALPAYRDLPIVALTAYALPGDRERFLEMGFTAYLSKPFDVDELMRLPAQLLAEKHA